MNIEKFLKEAKIMKIIEVGSEEWIDLSMLEDFINLDNLYQEELKDLKIVEKTYLETNQKYGTNIRVIEQHGTPLLLVIGRGRYQSHKETIILHEKEFGDFLVDILKKCLIEDKTEKIIPEDIKILNGEAIKI